VVYLRIVYCHHLSLFYRRQTRTFRLSSPNVGANYIIQDGIIENAEDVVGNLGINQSGELGFSRLIESIDGEASVINFRSVEKLYEQFSKTFE